MYFPGTHRKQGLTKHGTRSRKEPLGTMVEMSSDSLSFVVSVSILSTHLLPDFPSGDQLSGFLCPTIAPELAYL